MQVKDSNDLYGAYDAKKKKAKQASSASVTTANIGANALNKAPVLTAQIGANALRGKDVESDAGGLGDYNSYSFAQSDSSKNAQAQANSYLSNFNNVASKYQNGIVGQDVWDRINSQFSMSENTLNALNQLNASLDAVRSGRTNYSDKVDSMIDKISNREAFSYDPNSDALFQNALASAMSSGQQAMQDTIGQASALTGGYGSSYAVSSANQAYNNYVQGAYDNLPDFYNMALSQYQSEGNDMYNLLNAYQTQDESEYNRMLQNYNMDYNQYNMLYNQDYNSWLSTVNNAISQAGLQMDEASQIMNNAYNQYNANQNYADTLYSREYNNYLSNVSQNQWAKEMENSNYWKQAQLDLDKYQYDTTLSENQRQFDETNATNIYKAELSSSSSSSSSSNYKNHEEEYKQKAVEALNSGGSNGLLKYLQSVEDNLSQSEVDAIADYAYKWAGTDVENTGLRVANYFSKYTK